MSITIVRYRTETDRADENQQLVEGVFADLAAEQPDGLRYMTFRLGDGTFVHIADIEGDNPLAQSEAFARFTADIGDRCVSGEEPNPQPATVVGSYGFDL